MEKKDLDILKTKIENLAKAYEEVYADEYKEFLKATKKKRALQKTDYASTKGHVLERVLTEVPETLFVLLKQTLFPFEFDWYTSTEGTKWFAKNFKQYTLAKKI